MNVIPSKEDLLTEFKSDIKEKNGLPDTELIEAVVAMTNADGGTIYIGVEDNGKATGLIDKHKDYIGLTALIANNTVPPVSVRAEIITQNKTEILRIEVPKAHAITASASGRILKRRLKFDGSPEAVPLFPYEIQSRLSELSLLDFSAQPVNLATLEDFDISEFAHLKEVIRNNPGSDKSLLELQDEDFYKALHFITNSNGKETPTVTGLLFIGKNESLKKLLPTHKATFQILTGTNIKINETLTEPLLKIIEKFTTYFVPWNPEKEMEQGLFRIKIPEFSMSAFREGLLNAFCHRDYTQLGQVRILIDDDGLTISSKGGFIEGVNSENLISVEPHGRNPCLSESLKRIGLVEKTGRGIDRIFEGSVAFGRPWPDYSESTTETVKLFIPRSKPDIQFIKMIADIQNKNNRTLSINTLLILSLIKNGQKLTAKHLSEVIHISETRTNTTIESLIDLDLIDTAGSGLNEVYFLKPGIYKHNNDLVCDEHKNYSSLILKQANKQGGIINKEDVMNLLKITDNQAYIQIKKLIKGKKLQTNQKGKYSNYKLVK